MTTTPDTAVEIVGDRPNLNITHTTDVDAWRAHIEAVRAENAARRAREEAALASQSPAALAAGRNARTGKGAAPQSKRARASRVAGQRDGLAVIRPCAGCQRSTRPQSRSEADFPGTVARHTREYCLNCYMQTRRTGTPRPELIRPCKECGRMTRPSARTLEEFPGTVRRIAKDMCATCQERAEYRAEHGVERPRLQRSREVIRPCAECGQMTRPTSRRAEDFPNTVLRMDSRLCITCYRHAHGGAPKPKPAPVRPCPECQRPTRPARSTAADFPGTAPRNAGGLCAACYQRGRRAAQRQTAVAS